VSLKKSPTTRDTAFVLAEIIGEIAGEVVGEYLSWKTMATLR
jgi:hypothetical protein